MNNEKEVYFAEWCKKCKYYKADEEHLNPDHPCWECLDEPVNIDSHKPVRFEKAGKEELQKKEERRKKRATKKEKNDV